MVFSTIRRAWMRGCPLVSLCTADQPAAFSEIAKACGSVDASPSAAVLSWDCVRGWQAANRVGQQVASELSNSPVLAATALADLLEKHNFVESLQRVVYVIYSAPDWLGDPRVRTCLTILRDQLKQRQSTICLLGPMSMKLPESLRYDCIELTEPLPEDDRLWLAAKDVASAAGVSVEEDDLRMAAQKLRGVSVFGAEQLSALAIEQDGYCEESLDQYRQRKINETPGLMMLPPKHSSEIAGLEAIKSFLGRLMTGDAAPRAVVFVDEIEKVIHGQGDTSGVSQDQLGQLLSYMQDRRAGGCLFVGPPGSGKSALAKVAGSLSGVPTIALDLGAAKGSLVGQSEARVREALSVIDGVSGGQTIWIATANNVHAIPPELKRRFRWGTWFFDLPTLSERLSIWEAYTRRYCPQESPGDLVHEAWTGAEIESCCEITWRLQTTLQEASRFIVPVSRHSAEMITAMRTQAEGRYLSAVSGGVYTRVQERTESRQIVIS